MRGDDAPIRERLLVDREIRGMTVFIRGFELIKPNPIEYLDIAAAEWAFPEVISLVAARRPVYR
jgi:hypothetical protein